MKYINYIKSDTLAGLTTSFAMVPEVIGFAFVAGVNPITGLYAAFVAGLITALYGGRPGMITGGAGSLAVVSAALVATHGPQYLFGAVALMGVIQLLIGLFRCGKFIQLVSRPVMMGFVNGLAIVIFLAQLRRFEVRDVAGGYHLLPGVQFVTMALLVGLTVAITYLLPRFTRALPSSLVAIVIVTCLVHGFHLPTSSVQDLAEVHGAWPMFHIPAIPLTLGTLWIILPYAVLLSGVGLSETLLTQILVDSITGTTSSNDRECIGQGLANVATGFFSGMGGCAMIAQTMLNLESGGRGRLSGVVEALCILAFIVCASGLIGMIPMAALVGVMFVVVAKTFAWSSFRIIGKMPKSDAFALVLVSVVTVAFNLATAVAAGVVFCCLSFAWSNATRVEAKRYVGNDDQVIYEIHGPVFFGSSASFQSLFDPLLDTGTTTLDLRYTYLHDYSSLAAVEAVSKRYTENGKILRLVNLSPNCRSLLISNKSPLLDHCFQGAENHVATDRLASVVE